MSPPTAAALPVSESTPSTRVGRRSLLLRMVTIMAGLVLLFLATVVVGAVTGLWNPWVRTARADLILFRYAGPGSRLEIEATLADGAVRYGSLDSST